MLQEIVKQFWLGTIGPTFLQSLTIMQIKRKETESFLQVSKLKILGFGSLPFFLENGNFSRRIYRKIPTKPPLPQVAETTEGPITKGRYDIIMQDLIH